MWNYTYALDYGDLDGVVDKFADDAMMEVSMRSGAKEGALVGKYPGKKAIKELYASVIPEKTRFTGAHMLTNPVVTVEGDKAKGRFYLFGASTLQRPEGERATWSQGRYDNDFVKVGGKWKISHFRFLWNFMTNYDEGWVKTPMLEI